jgi:hypothetical protein
MTIHEFLICAVVWGREIASCIVDHVLGIEAAALFLLKMIDHDLGWLQAFTYGAVGWTARLAGSELLRAFLTTLAKRIWQQLLRAAGEP